MLTSERNASRGKLHEGLIGNFLSPEEDIYYTTRPGGLKELIIESNDPEYKHRWFIAKAAAKYAKERLPPITKVYWTSNPKDVSVLLGFEEHNPSDLVVLAESRFYGISVKLKHRRGLTNKGNKGAWETDRTFDIDTQKILEPYKQQLYDAATKHNITIPSKGMDAFLRECLILKTIDKKMKIAGYEKLANVVREKLKDYDGYAFAQLIREGIGHDRRPAFPVYELETIDRKNSLEHRFVDSYEETGRILEIHRPYLRLQENKGRTLNIIGKDDVLVCRINVNSRSSSILSPVQFRWFAWGKDCK